MITHIQMPAKLLSLIAAAFFIGNAKTGAQSVDQTVQWLAGKLVNHRTVYEMAGVSIIAKEITALRVEKGVLIISGNNQVSWLNGGGHGKNLYTTSVPLNRMSTRCEVQLQSELRADRNVYRVLVESSGGQQVVSHVQSMSGGQATRSQSKGLVLEFTDEELANRVAKALSNLVKLHGGKDEPF